MRVLLQKCRLKLLWIKLYLHFHVILSLTQNLLEMLKLSWIIRGEGGVTSDPHFTGSALLHPTENPQVQHDKMEPSLSPCNPIAFYPETS